MHHDFLNLVTLTSAMSTIAIVRPEQGTLLFVLLLGERTLRSPVSRRSNQMLYQAQISNSGPAITDVSAAVTKPLRNSPVRIPCGDRYIIRSVRLVVAWEVSIGEGPSVKIRVKAESRCTENGQG